MVVAVAVVCGVIGVVSYVCGTTSVFDVICVVDAGVRVAVVGCVACCCVANIAIAVDDDVIA